MSIRLGNKYLIAVYTKPTYGAAISDYSSLTPKVFYDKMDLPTTKIAAVSNGQKTLTLQSLISEQLAGRKSGEITISGELTDDHESWLLPAYTTDSATPYVPAETTTPLIYQIWRVHSDGKADKADDCVLSKLDITGKSGELMKYTATFRISTSAPEVTISGLTGFKTYAECVALKGTAAIFKFCGLTLTNLLGAVNSGDEYTKANSITLSLGRDFIDDDAIYQNSCTKATEIVSGYNGSLSFVTNFDNGMSVDESDLFASARGKALFTMSDGTHAWAITCEGQLVEMPNVPDPDKGLYILSGTIQLGKHTSNMLSIATT